MKKVCKVEKLRSTFHSLHDYLNFYGEKKMTGYLPFTHDRAMTTITAMYSLIHKFCGNTRKNHLIGDGFYIEFEEVI